MDPLNGSKWSINISWSEGKPCSCIYDQDFRDGLDVVRPSLGPMRDLVVVGGAAVGRRGSANYVGGCWRSSHIRCRKCAVGYAARNASAHHKAVHRQQRHHRQCSTWRSDHNRLLGSGGSAAASVMSSEAQNAHGACGTVGAVR